MRFFWMAALLKLNARGHHISDCENNMYKSYFDIGLEIADLEKQLSEIRSSNILTRGQRKFPKSQSQIESEISGLIALQTETPVRAKAEIDADLEKYCTKIKAIQDNRTYVSGPSMTRDEWMAESEDSTGFWKCASEGCELDKLAAKVKILTNELTHT